MHTIKWMGMFVFFLMLWKWYLFNCDGTVTVTVTLIISLHSNYETARRQRRLFPPGYLASGYGFGFDSSVGAGAGLWFMRADDVFTNYPAAMETTWIKNMNKLWGDVILIRMAWRLSVEIWIYGRGWMARMSMILLGGIYILCWRCSGSWLALSLLEYA